MLAVTLPLTGWVTADPSTFKAVIEVMPWTVRTSEEADPAVPNAGCLAAVDAPEGKGRDEAETGCVACQNVPLTGCVTAEPSTFKAVMLAIP